MLDKLLETLSVNGWAGTVVSFGKNGATVLQGIKELREATHEVIHNAIRSGNQATIDVVARLGFEVSKAIDHFEEAYKDELNYTLDRLSPVVYNAFIQLEASFSSFVKQVEAANKDAISGVQQITLTLPLAKDRSQLTSVNPRFFVIANLTAKSVVTLRGVFPGASWNYQPTLHFDQKSCKLLHSSTQELQFEIPHDFFKNSLDKKRFSPITGTLCAPWFDGIIWKSKVEACFPITLHALPSIAGTISKMQFTYKENVSKRIPMQKWFFYEHYVNKRNPHQAWYVPDRGCEFDTTKEPIVHMSFSTPIKKELYKDRLGVIVEWNKTQWNTVRATIEVTQVCTIQTEESKECVDESLVEIGWGETKSLGHPGQTLQKFLFEDHMGQKFEYIAPFHNTGVLKVQIGGETPQVHAMIPKDGDVLMKMMNGMLLPAKL